ncbi:MAG: carbamoyl phosphate synthase large subunit [Alphaproteobacteria bacterium TMED87]|nr:carbamoyl phosphate synthase large subunit [Rhodospirillaceae bacterium]OUV09895.1 MAG: carbamoyl phosphate synthase large subunit [Alphaproteobacteria bacterium TMED87]
MPKRNDLKSILIIGAGPIVIGQACEFDYSGAQACKALKEEGYRVVLVNSNPATIMTDPEMADATYIEPINLEVLCKILRKEKPDAILPTMGGQTALNIAIELSNDGILSELGIELIGAKKTVIEKAEDRLLFREAMTKIGLESPKSQIVHSLDEALEALTTIKLPSIIRPSFTLGGQGGGIAYNTDEFKQIVQSGLDASPVDEVLVEESVTGWKEYEMEVVRDRMDNCIIVCSIENVDPMGIHTGDSVTVAPALTLTDKEFQIMRDASISCLREIGVDTGGSNVQFAVNPADGRLVIIEMNPRVSRSSALASKATGFPIAKIAAKLAIGYTLDELKNDITGSTPASFEPTIDYVVTKIPRFTFEKFPDTEALLTTSMKSVGEVMSIGRSFCESIQKGLRSIETGLNGFNDISFEGNEEIRLESLKVALSSPRPDRLILIAQAFREGISLNEINNITKFDPWFLEQIEIIINKEREIIDNGIPTEPEEFLNFKTLGFSDSRLADLAGLKEKNVSLKRRELKVLPTYKRIDTCAGEFKSNTPYLYSTYEANAYFNRDCESEPSGNKKIIILGGGPNRIGQGIEFDYCCCHASFALSEAGYETVMVNCNPETVSTDYDTSDRLYFEPLTVEDVYELIDVEKSKGTLLGIIVQLGGQTPLKIANELENLGVPILGTSSDAIDLAEDRERFKKLLDKLDLKQPENVTISDESDALKIANIIGYPVVIRPSYVLGGRAMQIIHDDFSLKKYISEAVEVSGKNPLLIDSYLSGAIEVDVDALCDGKNIYIAGIMEHIEEAGIHSGDSACSLPPYSLSNQIIDEIEKQTKTLAYSLNVKGLMNVQFAIKDSDIYILEVNPRASRTVPFVAKSTGVPIAKIASRVMADESLANFNLPIDKPYNEYKPHNHVSVKEAVFPFSRFPGSDIVLGPEMKSTGEVMGIDKSFSRAFAKSQLGASISLPFKGGAFLSLKDTDKAEALLIAKKLNEIGFNLIATKGTADYLSSKGLDVKYVNKVRQGRPHCVDAMISGDIQLVINTTDGNQSLRDSFDIRRTALNRQICHYTTLSGAKAGVDSIEALQDNDIEVFSLQSYFK